MGPPTFHLTLDYGALCDCTGHIHADSPEISKYNTPQPPPSNPYFSDLPEPCSYGGRVFQDGDDWPLSRCAKCVCRNGTTQCFAAQCQPLFCNPVRKTASEWILHRPFTSLYRTWSPFWDNIKQPWKSRNRKQRLFFLTLLETTADTFLLPWEAIDRSNYQPVRLIVALWDWVLRVHTKKPPSPDADVPKMSKSTSGNISNIDQVCYCLSIQKYMLLFEDYSDTVFNFYKIMIQLSKVFLWVSLK